MRDHHARIPSDFLRNFRTSISILRNKEEKCLRRCINNGYLNIRISTLHFGEILSEPVLMRIETMWWVEIHKLNTERIRHFHDFLNQLLRHAPLWGCDTDDRNIRDSSNLSKIGLVPCVIESMCQGEVDAIIVRISRQCEDMMEFISEQGCSRENEHEENYYRYTVP